MAMPALNISPVTIGASNLPAGSSTANMLPAASDNFVFVVTFIALTAFPAAAGESMELHYQHAGEMDTVVAAIVGDSASSGFMTNQTWETEIPCVPGDTIKAVNNTSLDPGTYVVSGYYWSPE